MLGGVVHRGDVALRGVILAGLHLRAIELTVGARVAADGQRTLLHKAVDGHGGLVTSGDGVDGKLGTGVDIAAHEDVRLGGLIGLGVCHGALAATQLHLRAGEQVTPHDCLAYGEHHAVALERAGVVLIVDRRETTLVIEHGDTALESDAAHATVLAHEDLLGTPAMRDGHAVLGSLALLILASGHLGLGFQAEHLHALGTQTRRGARHVDGHVAAADDHGGAGKRRGLATVRLSLGDLAQEVHSHGNALGVLTRNARTTAALAADCHVEGLEALRAQLVERHVAPDLHAVAELGAHGLDHVNLGLDHVLLQLVAGNTIGEHAARTRVLLEHHRVVSLLGQVEGAGEARGTGADDGNLLLEVAAHLGAHLRGDVARVGVQILVGDELLDLIDRDGLVDRAARAGILAATVAHAAAHRGQRILALDEGERLLVATLRRQLEVALHGDVRGAGCLARGRARVVGLDAVLVAVVRAPLLGAPLHRVRQLLLGILGHPVRALLAELLAELDGARGAHLNAAAAGHAVLGLGVRHVGRAREVRGVEQLARTQGVAHVHVAVADGEDLVLTVDVGDLVHEAVVLRALEDLHGLLARDVAAAVGLHHVVGHVAHGDAPVVEVVTARFAHHFAAHTAGAGGSGVLALVLVQPVLDVLDGDGMALLLDGLLDGNDVHADTRASRRDHRRGLGERALARLLEELSVDGMLLQLAPAHVEELGGAGHEHGQHPLLGAGGILPVVLEQTRVGEVVEHLLQLAGLYTRGLHGSLERVRVAHLQLAEHIGLLVGGRLGKAPVLVAQQVLASEQTVGAVLAQAHDALARLVRYGRHELRANVRFGETDARSVQDHGIPLSLRANSLGDRPSAHRSPFGETC